MSPRSALRAWLRPVIDHAARRYVAGPRSADAVDRCVALARGGIRSTIGYWSDAGELSRRVVDGYLAAADLLARARLDCYLSVKAPAMGFQERMIRAVAERCRLHGLGLHFDSLGPDVADRTLGLIARVRADVSPLGCTLPGRWQRSLRDAEVAIRLGLRVRVVKGEWEAGENDAPMDPSDGLLAIVERVAGRVPHVAVATHDWRLARRALHHLRGASTSASVEVLLGMPATRVLAVARAFGVPARVYVPWGQSRLPYRLTRVPAQPRIAWQFLRDLTPYGA
ncbi:MAG: proline dehydrogenase [Candidatus Rokubacteria bacterium]|nr:proline dehydrogenase [Candidatus Rokubacteria bacterium]